jgi:hypothetical protein
MVPTWLIVVLVKLQAPTLGVRTHASGSGTGVTPVFGVATEAQLPLVKLPTMPIALAVMQALPRATTAFEPVELTAMPQLAPRSALPLTTSAFDVEGSIT